MVIIQIGQNFRRVHELVVMVQEQDQGIALTQCRNMGVKIVLLLVTVRKLNFVLHIHVQFMQTIRNGQNLLSVHGRVVTGQRREQEIAPILCLNMEATTVLCMAIIRTLYLVTHILVRFMAIIHSGQNFQRAQARVETVPKQERETAPILCHNTEVRTVLFTVTILRFSPVTRTLVQSMETIHSGEHSHTVRSLVETVQNIGHGIVPIRSLNMEVATVLFMVVILKLHLVIHILVQFMETIQSGRSSHSVRCLVVTVQNTGHEIVPIRLPNTEVATVLFMVIILRMHLVIHILVQFTEIIQYGRSSRSVRCHVETVQRLGEDIVPIPLPNTEVAIALFMAIILKLYIVMHILVRFMEIIQNGRNSQSVRCHVVTVQRLGRETVPIRFPNTEVAIALIMVITFKLYIAIHILVQFMETIHIGRSSRSVRCLVVTVQRLGRETVPIRFPNTEVAIALIMVITFKLYIVIHILVQFTETIHIGRSSRSVRYLVVTVQRLGREIVPIPLLNTEVAIALFMVITFKLYLVTLILVQFMETIRIGRSSRSVRCLVVSVQRLGREIAPIRLPNTEVATVLFMVIILRMHLVIHILVQFTEIIQYGRSSRSVRCHVETVQRLGEDIVPIPLPNTEVAIALFMAIILKLYIVMHILVRFMEIIQNGRNSQSVRCHVVTVQRLGRETVPIRFPNTEVAIALIMVITFKLYIAIHILVQFMETIHIGRSSRSVRCLVVTVQRLGRETVPIRFPNTEVAIALIMVITFKLYIVIHILVQFTETIHIGRSSRSVRYLVVTVQRLGREIVPIPLLNTEVAIALFMVITFKLYLVTLILVQFMETIHIGRSSRSVRCLVVSVQRLGREIAPIRLPNTEVATVLFMVIILKLHLVIHILVQFMETIQNGQAFHLVHSRAVTVQRQGQEAVLILRHNMEVTIARTMVTVPMFLPVIPTTVQ